MDGVIIAYSIICFIGYAFIVLIINTVLNMADIFRINIKLPKNNKKYLNKVDPIYEIYEGGWGNTVILNKYEIKYDYNEDSIINFIFSCLIPLNINFINYGYHKNEFYYVDYVNDLTYYKTLDIVIAKYEEEYKKHNDKIEEAKNLAYKKENLTKKLNNVFRENYE